MHSSAKNYFIYTKTETETAVFTLQKNETETEMKFRKPTSSTFHLQIPFPLSVGMHETLR